MGLEYTAIERGGEWEKIKQYMRGERGQQKDNE